LRKSNGQVEQLLNFASQRRPHHHNRPKPLSTPTSLANMSLLSSSSQALVRHVAKQQLPTLRSSAAAMQKRNRADASTSHANFTSPFHRGKGNAQDTTVIPSWKGYQGGSETTNKVFQYFMVGAFGGLSALGAKDTVQSA